MTIEVRPVRPDEYAALGDLTVAAYLAVGETDDHDYLEHIRDVATRAAVCPVLVAVDDQGRVLGGVTYVPGPGTPYSELEQDGEAGIRMLAVDPDVQGRGVGRRLVEACLERARADGRRGMVLRDPPVHAQRASAVRIARVPAGARARLVAGPGRRAARVRAPSWPRSGERGARAARRAARSTGPGRAPAGGDDRPRPVGAGRARGPAHPSTRHDGVRRGPPRVPGRPGGGRRRPARARPPYPRTARRPGVPGPPPDRGDPRDLGGGRRPARRHSGRVDRIDAWPAALGRAIRRCRGLRRARRPARPDVADRCARRDRRLDDAAVDAPPVRRPVLRRRAPAGRGAPARSSRGRGAHLAHASSGADPDGRRDDPDVAADLDHPPADRAGGLVRGDPGPAWPSSPTCRSGPSGSRPGSRS